jgi:hypothetical protein|tara:strand:+ start:733 stop:975 length:243 start_codon:yes stop_codon:yes gene_type:complete
MNRDEFLKAAQSGTVTVEFRKIDTNELRVMPCTLNRELSGNNVPEVLEQRPDSDHYAVWSIDKQAWRSFRVSTVETWYVS